MASSYSVWTNFLLKDKMSPGFKKMGKAAAGFGSTLKAILTAGFIQRGITYLTDGIRTATQEFINYDQAITGASAKFKGLDVTTEAGIKTLEKLKQQARATGAETQYSASEAAQGLDFLAMAGFNAEQAIVSLPGVTNLATAANTDLARATDIASDSLGAFGLMTEKTKALQTNLTRVNDVFAKTITSTNTDLDTLFESVKKGAASFTAAGQSIESFSALAGVMANNGLKGAESGTQLRNIMLRLAKPTKEANSVLQNLNIKTQDAQGNFLDVVDILGQFEKATKKMGTSQRSAALATVFGARSVTGINILLGEGAEKLKAFRNELKDSTGASQKMANVIRSSLENRLKTLQSTALELGFKFIDAFKGKAADAIGFFTEVLRKIPVDNILKFFNQLWKFIKPLVSAVFDLGKAIFNLGKGIYETLESAGVFNFIFGTLQNIVGFVSDAIKGLAKVLNFLSPVLKIIIPLLAAWVGIQTVLNILLTANPLGLIIMGIVAAITALTAAVLWLVENWDNVIAGFQFVAGVVGEALMTAIKGIGDFFGFLGEKIQQVLGFFQALAAIISGVVVGAFQGLWKIIEPIIKGIGDFVGGVGDFFGGAIGGVGDFFGGIGKGIGDFFTGGGKSEAPNKREVEARQQINFEGNLNINGAPPGSTFNGKTTGAPALNYKLLGAS
jgi:TP901 family phage tail tape measure protein